jgi:hypothetical protein
MYRNVNLDAHMSALLFLGSAALLLVLLLTMLILFFSRRQWMRYASIAVTVLVVGYAVLLVGFSIFSREHTLAQGEEKYFCELDCHVAYSVQSVERVKAIGGTVAHGEFYVVTIRARFDEHTTAPWRPRDVPVTPDPLRFALVNADGVATSPSAAGQKAWDSLHRASPTLFSPLLPGESRQATFVFEASPMQNPRLLASFQSFPTQVLIGDENSLLHRKTYFGLQLDPVQRS